MRLCLISSNIRFDNPADGVNTWVNRRDILTETLLAHNPDIIATQEGRLLQLKNLEEGLVDFEIVDHHRVWINERMYPSFFIRKNKFEIIQSHDLWLSETPLIPGSQSFGSAFPRLMTSMKIRPKSTNVNFLLINTHLDHVKAETRVEQIKVMVEQIKFLKDPSSHLIIMGDFNDSPNSEVRNIIFNAFPELVDSWKIFNNTEETSHHAFSGECQNGSRIDWILTDKRINLNNCLLDKRTIGGRYPSDHFPVVCQINI